MKSGVTSSSRIALQMASTSRRVPTHSLKPVGLPPASSRIRAMNRTSSRGVAKTRWCGGLTHFSPCGTLRASAISLVTLAPGSTPPMPGLAPWLSFSDTHLTFGCAALSANMAASKSPSWVRQPK